MIVGKAKRVRPEGLYLHRRHKDVSQHSLYVGRCDIHLRIVLPCVEFGEIQFQTVFPEQGREAMSCKSQTSVLQGNAEGGRERVDDDNVGGDILEFQMDLHLSLKGFV